MNTIQFRDLLLHMAAQARRRGIERRSGPEARIMFDLTSMLEAGAEKCNEIAAAEADKTLEQPG